MGLRQFVASDSIRRFARLGCLSAARMCVPVSDSKLHNGEGIVMRDQLALLDTTSDRVSAFAAALTALSVEHGIGLAQPATLFLLESDDYDRRYVINGDEIEFA